MRHYYKIIEYNKHDKNFELESVDCGGEIETVDLLSDELFSSYYSNPEALVGMKISVSYLQTFVSYAIDPKIEY